MTENEAIKAIQNDLKWHSKELQPAYKEVLRMAIQALEEIQAIKNIINDFALDCGSTVQDIKEICSQLYKYLGIGSIEEFKALKENQRKCEDCAGCTNWKCDCANIRAKAIDEFLHNAEVKIYDKILQNQSRLDFASGLSVANRMLDEIAEEMRGGT